MLLDQAPAAPSGIAVVPVGDAAQAVAAQVMQTLRAAGLRAEMAYRGNLKKRMERANRIDAPFAVIVGESEAARGVVQLKNLSDGTQDEVPIQDLAARIAGAGSAQ